MIKTIKGIIEKIKFRFNGVGNQEFVFESNIEVPFCDPEVIEGDEVEEKFIDSVEVANIDLTSRKDIKGLRRLSKIEKYYIYTSIVDKDKLHLVRVLLNTKKFRVRKKLIKRLL